MNTRHLLPSGYAWAILRPGGAAHILAIEHMWKRLEPGSTSVVDYNMPLSPKTECGFPTQDSIIQAMYMTMSEDSACRTCWEIRHRY